MFQRWDTRSAKDQVQLRCRIWSMGWGRAAGSWLPLPNLEGWMSNAPWLATYDLSLPFTLPLPLLHPPVPIALLSPSSCLNYDRTGRSRHWRPWSSADSEFGLVLQYTPFFSTSGGSPRRAGAVTDVQLQLHQTRFFYIVCYCCYDICLDNK